MAVNFPSETGAGLNFYAAIDLADYAAPAWTVSAILRGPAAINLTASATAAGFVFNVPAATTATWAPGTYWFSLRATNGSAVHEIGSGQLTVTPDLAQATGTFDGRSHNQIALDSIKAVLAKRATQDQLRYAINNRELWRTPIADLLKLKAHYTAQVRRELARKRGDGSLGRTIPVRFNPGRTIPVGFN
jgi:hypothetical protein